MSRTELIEVRKQFLKDMNTYICELGDEECWMAWIQDGVPDEPTEDDYDFIASSDSTWREICALFGELIMIYDRDDIEGD